MTARRARPVSAARNDIAIGDAAIAAVATLGWDRTTLARVANDAGLTEGAMYVRYPDKLAFGAALWTESVGPALSARIDAVLRAAVDHPDAPALSEALQPFLAPDAVLLAGLDLLHAAQFEPVLRDRVIADTAAALTAWCTSRRGHTRVDAARAAAAANLAFGLALVSARPWAAEAGETQLLARFQHALAHPVAPGTLPKDRATHLDAYHFTVDDERIRQAFEATLHEIGTVGYAHATIARICRAGDVSAGYLYKRYANKLELFTAAVDAMMRGSVDLNAAFAARLAEQYGVGIAEAVHWREFQRPKLARNRALELEANRLARYDDAMRAIRDATDTAIMEEFLAAGAKSDRAVRLGYMHTEMALGLGVILVANILPEVWRLPYDCVTVPLAEQGIA